MGIQAEKNPHRKFAEEETIRLLREITAIRQTENFSQRQISTIIGQTSHTMIASMESARVSPRIDNVLTVLSALGYTLNIVPKNEDS